MRLTAVAGVVLLLVVRSATLSRTTSAAPTTILTTTETTTDTTTDTTTEPYTSTPIDTTTTGPTTPTTSCPTIDDCYSTHRGPMLQCELETDDSGGCPFCACWTGAPPCLNPMNICGADNSCIDTDYPPYYYCITTPETPSPTPTTSTITPTTETTTDTPSTTPTTETSTSTETTTTEPTTPTTSCPTVDDCYLTNHGYHIECMLFPDDLGGCPECSCWTPAPPCYDVDQDPCGGNTCVGLDYPPYYLCLSTPETSTSTTVTTPTTESTTETTSEPATPATPCPTIDDCYANRQGYMLQCMLDSDGSGGCQSCNCWTGAPCHADECLGNQCIPTDDDPYYYCLTTPETPTSTTPTSPTTETTTGVTCGTYCMNYCPFGRVYDANGCPTCNCYTCEEACGPDAICTQSDDYFYTYNPFHKCVTTPGTSTPTTPTTPTTETTTEKGVKCGPVCKIYCQYGNVKDAKGCPTCKCFNPCENVLCLASEMCFVSRLENGSYIGQCIGTTLSTTATTATTSTFECPGITDPPCFPGCDTTYDYRGCRGCNCPTSCEDKTCPSGQICVLQPNPFDGWGCMYFVPCGPNIVVCVLDTTPTPSPCPIPECQRECLPDQNGPDGCPTCACPNCTCEDLACGPNDVCLFQYPECPPNTTPCPPQPTCAPSYTSTPCPLVKCAPGCVSDTGSDGCPTCECPPSCETVKCSAGYECQLVDVTCITYPCFPQPQCLPAEDPCSGAPNRRRCGGRALNRWTYNSNTDKCEKFRYYGCTTSPNTFNSPKACKNICKPICSPVACGDDCYTLKRKYNKCPKCICPNPCKGIRCRAGYECKLRETKCDAEPEPYCARK